MGTESETSGTKKEIERGAGNRVYATNETQLGTCPGQCSYLWSPRAFLSLFCGFGVFERATICA